MSWARAFAFNFAFFAWTAILGTVGLPFLFTPRSVTMRFGRFWAASVLVLLKLIVGLDHQIRGLDRVPRGGCIIAMKHQSTWDTLVLPVVLGDPAVVLKRELLWLPFYGWYAARAGAIAIDRKAGAGALRRMLARALPLVPAAVNSGLYWGRRSFVKRKGRIVLEFLEPIPPGRTRPRLMAELERRVETATAALLREGQETRRR
jgi:1-acyl-sn-glycerol-3-phosphate acyltransferase